LNTLIISTLSIILSYSGFVHGANNAFSLGVFPYVSTSKLISHNKHVIKHINRTTKYDVSLVTAKNAPSYVSNLKNFEYDFIFTPPHLARFVEKQFAYQRVVMTSHNIRGVYLTKQDSAIHTLKDLQNKKLSLGPAKTILHQLTLNELNNYNIVPEKNITLQIVNTHNNAIYDLLKGDSDAAVTGVKIWQKLAASKKSQLRQISLTAPSSGFIILAKPGMNKTIIKELQDSLLAFNKTIAAKTYLFNGFQLLKENDMRSLDIHAKIFE